MGHLVILKLSEKLAWQLTLVGERTGLSDTNVLRHALALYDQMTEAQAAGATFTVTRDGKTERLVIE